MPLTTDIWKNVDFLLHVPNICFSFPVMMELQHSGPLSPQATGAWKCLREGNREHQNDDCRWTVWSWTLSLSITHGEGRFHMCSSSSAASEPGEAVLLMNPSLSTYGSKQTRCSVPGLRHSLEVPVVFGDMMPSCLPSLSLLPGPSVGVPIPSQKHYPQMKQPQFPSCLLYG